jgi:hypothetical protein
MGDFFNSQFIKDLQAGKLPPVEVKFSTQSLIEVSFAALATAIVIIIVVNIFKRL